MLIGPGLILVGLAACTPEAATSRAINGDLHGRHLSFPEAPSAIECLGPDGDTLRFDGDIELDVHGLLADSTYTCTGDDGAAVEFTTDPLPENLPLPHVDVPGDPWEVGYRITNVFRNGTNGIGQVRSEDMFVVIFDAQGRPRWHREGDFGADTDVSFVGGRILVGGFAGDVSSNNTKPTFYTLNGDASWSARGEPVWEGEQPGSWHHDCGMGVDGDRVFALSRETLEDGVTEGFIVHGISMETGETEWSYSSALDGLGKGLPDPDPDREDPWHANAVWEAVEDGAHVLYVSLNEVEIVLRIDEDSKTVTDSIGGLGDWTLANEGVTEDDRWFHRQHDAKVYDRKTMVVFDNGAAQTRVVKLAVDFPTKTAAVQQVWSDGGTWVDRWGGVDLVGDALDVALPHWEVGSAPAALLRVEADNTVSWRLSWPDDEVSMYRSETIAADDIFNIVE